MKTASEIKAEIGKLEDEILYLGYEIDDLKDEIEENERKCAYLEDKQYDLEKELYRTIFSNTPDAALEAFFNTICINDFDKLCGQMRIDDYYVLCNGYIAIYNKKPFDGVREITPLEPLGAYLFNEREPIEVINYSESEEEFIYLGNSKVKIDNSRLEIAINILGLPKEIKIMGKNEPIEFSTEKGTAIICHCKY